MNKIFLVVATCMLLAIWFFYPKSTHNKLATIGLLLPMQHAALDEIARGFTAEIENLMGAHTIKIETHNALGDINLQKSALNKLINDHAEIIVPITTGTTQMAINLAPKSQAIVFLAANIAPDSLAAHTKPGLMGIIDEIDVKKQLAFIKTVMPELKKMTLIFSSSDKMPDDAENFSKAASEQHISVQKLMIQHLSELYTVASRINKDSQALLILKDNLVASGIEALVQQARLLKIPLITSDEGTNKKGSAFALGVIESDIGRQGARLAAAFLKKQEIKNPIEYLEKLIVFINSKACESQGVELEKIIKAAAFYNYEVIKQ